MSLRNLSVAEGLAREFLLNQSEWRKDTKTKPIIGKISQQQPDPYASGVTKQLSTTLW
jgi:hypothetical protein